RKERKQKPENYKEIRVMTLNCRYGKANAAQIIETAKKYNVNTLLLQELSESLVKNLEKLGIYEIFPTSCVGAQSEHNNGGFNAIFTQYSAISTCNNAVKIEAASVPSITTRLDFSASTNVFVNFASAHPKSPMRGCKAWSEGIRALANLVKISKSTKSTESTKSTKSTNIAETYTSVKTTSTTETCDLSTLTILTGDLNSAIDHPSFRTLIKAGFSDSAISLGKRLRTWPTWLKWPNLTLDHVLFCSKNLRAKAVQQKNAVIDGTDHLAYIASIALYTLE
ncbi:endonuclease, partial [Bifidobacteriaceae bacterium WP012]